MESFHSVPCLRAIFTVVGCPRIHHRIKGRDIAEKANGYSTNSSMTRAKKSFVILW